MLARNTFVALVLTSLIGSITIPAQAATGQAPHRQLLLAAGYGASTRPKVISFHADWCPACEQLQPAINKAKSRFADEMDFISVNIDDEKNRDLVRLYKVRGVPAVVFINERGKVVDSFMGYDTKALKRGLQELVHENKAIAATATTTQ